MDDTAGKEAQMIDAAIQCIEAYGLEGATIRRIAEAAGVNSAMISYYFRSKDRLLEQAMAVSLDHAFDWNDFPRLDELPLTDYLVTVFMRLVEGANQYPGLTRAHFLSMFSTGPYQALTRTRINRFFEETIREIIAHDPGQDEQRLRLALAQIASAAFVVPALMPDLFQPFHPIDFTDRNVLHGYINRIVAGLLSANRCVSD